MINIFAYGGRHGSFLHLNEKALFSAFVCMHMYRPVLFEGKEQRVSSLAVISKYCFLPL